MKHIRRRKFRWIILSAIFITVCCAFLNSSLQRKPMQYKAEVLRTRTKSTFQESELPEQPTNRKKFGAKEEIKKENKKTEEKDGTSKATKCGWQPSWENILPKTSLNVDMKKWSFKTNSTCATFPSLVPPKTRKKLILDCKDDKATIKYVDTTDVFNATDVFKVPFKNACLGDVIDNCCLGNNTPVPNVVHYVWYSHRELGFFHFLSFMSALRFVKPCLILIHGNDVPYGKYWDYFISITPNVVHVKRDRPTTVFGHKLAYAEHSSDIMRIEALRIYGGIYLDFDEIVLRPLKPLMKYEYTQGYEAKDALGSQLIMAKKNAEFLKHWYQSYKDDYKYNWGYNAIMLPGKLAKKKPNLIHVEGFNFTRPNWKQANLIFNKNFDWSINYAMHIHMRWYKNITTIENIRQLNTTIGSVSRYVLLGNKELCQN